MKINDYDLYYLVKYFEPSYASQLYSEGGGGSDVVKLTMTEVVVTDQAVDTLILLFYFLFFSIDYWLLDACMYVDVRKYEDIVV